MALSELAFSAARSAMSASARAVALASLVILAMARDTAYSLSVEVECLEACVRPRPRPVSSRLSWWWLGSW